jgi:hypothetical protein
MRPTDNRVAPLIWVALAGTALALVGAVGMVAAPSSDVLGSAGSPEGWFGLLCVIGVGFFLFVYRSYGRSRALKLAAAAGIGALACGLWAAVTMPPDCGQLGDQGLPVACLDLYGKDPNAVLSPSTWGIWLLAIGGLIAAGAAIVTLFALARLPAPEQRARTRERRPRQTPEQRLAERRAAARRRAGGPADPAP